MASAMAAATLTYSTNQNKRFSVAPSCRLAFMASGMAAATLTNSAAAAGIAAQPPPLAMPSSDVANSGGLLIASALLAMLGLASAGQQVRQSWLRLI